MNTIGSDTIHARLLEKGVIIHCPESVHIDNSVDPDRIETNTTIHAGSRIRGADTLICDGAVIGLEAPATIDNCLIGPGVSLKGGFFKNGVFLKGASVGSGGHLREGTILEEYASAAHTVGLKQTILFPFVTLGSLVNFCDCLMAGGTGPNNHSEVGSAYIHFNFTPHQDKVTPSMMGDVPSGVMLNQPPVFLGGQGGLVGPARLAFGTVTAAGTICRTDEHRPGRLIFGGPSKKGNVAYQTAFYQNIKTITLKNINYISEIIALSCWYNHVRARFVSEQMPWSLLRGLQCNIEAAIRERLKRLMAFAEKMPSSAAAYEQSAGEKASQALLEQKRQLFENRNALEDLILQQAEIQKKEGQASTAFLDAIDRAIDLHGKNDYVKTIQMLGQKDAETGTAWLRGVADETRRQCIAVLPAFA